MHITVCICTHRRPHQLVRLLAAVVSQETRGRFTISIVVADNDSNASARPFVENFTATSPMPLVYCIEPRRNVALARNRAISMALGDFTAWIDDDELPCSDWLRRLLATCERWDSAAALGPVRPHFETPPPAWVVKGRFCERPEHATGTLLDWHACRAGNVLFRRDLLDPLPGPFRAEFGLGGEDQDFFRRMAARGHAFVWCNEAVVHEVVPPKRLTRSYVLRRAMLHGGNSTRLVDRAAVVKSSIAVPIYALALPVGFFAGQHTFMRWAAKLAGHLGRLLGHFGMNPILQRPP